MRKLRGNGERVRKYSAGGRKNFISVFPSLCREILPSEFTHFFRRFLETEKQNPQTFSLLECMPCACNWVTQFVPVHYRLRSIEGGQFRLVNFASHFIRVQIFQIDFPLILSVSKYFRWISLSFSICRGQNKHFSMNYVRKKGRVELI